MLSREDNERVTRVGRGTPMGTTMRRYWIPALLEWELPAPDCPHRQASLFFGRNEGCGLRCVYHGWKFDVDGRCVDMMNEPEELHFKNKVRTTSYPMVEAGGILWAYMGPPELQPP